MATKKTTKPVEEVEPDIEVVDDAPELTSAEEAHEAFLDKDELLADMPPLRAPERLRLGHKNGIKKIGYLYKDRIKQLGIPEDENGDSEITTEQAFLLLDVADEVDQWAETIAVDKIAYQAWAEANSDNPDKFLAVMTRYMSAVGE